MYVCVHGDDEYEFMDEGDVSLSNTGICPATGGLLKNKSMNGWKKSKTELKKQISQPKHVRTIRNSPAKQKQGHW